MSRSAFRSVLSCAWLSLLMLIGVGSARADASPVVLWLDGGDAGRAAEREHALRLELEARGMLLLTAEPSAADAAAPAEAASRETLARSTLARASADAVLWLEGDAKRPVTWLRVVDRRTDAIAQAPLPHPPDAIDPELFAVAAASLLEQVLRAPASSAGPGVQPPSTPPAAAETPAPPPAPAPAAVARTAPARPRAPSVASAPAAPAWFVEVGVVLALAHLHSGKEAATRPTEDQIFLTQNGRRFSVAVPGRVPGQRRRPSPARTARSLNAHCVASPFPSGPTGNSQIGCPSRQ